MATTKTSRSATPFIVAGGITIGLFITAYLLITLTYGSRTQQCLGSPSIRPQEWSPISHRVSMEYVTQTFNGSFRQQTIYRGRPGPRTDDAWHDLGIMYGPVLVPEVEAANFGISPDHYKVPNSDGGSSFPVHIEVLHQLHCLNLLRKALFFNADYYRQQAREEFANEGELLELHITHCLDILRQRLMCTGDVGLVPYYRKKHDDGTSYTMPDFSRPHSCRNFDAIRAWGESNKHDDLGHKEHE